MNKDKEFTECYNIWLRNKGIKHSLNNFQRYCQIWNQKINEATKEPITEFRNSLSNNWNMEEIKTKFKKIRGLNLVIYR